MTKKQRRDHYKKLRSVEALAAITRGGAGFHTPRHQKRQTRQSWRKEWS